MNASTEIAAPPFIPPAHVPPELVRDFDFLAEKIDGDVFDWWTRLRAWPDIFYTPRQGGHWVLTRHDHIAHAMAHFPVFSSTGMTIPLDRTRAPLPPIEYDPPLHGDFRRLIAPFFMPKSIGNLEHRARDLTTRLIDGFIDRGECEFVSEFSLAMPIGIFMGLVDLPEEDRLYLLDCAEAIVRGATPEAQGMGFMRANQYLAKIFAARRAEPGEDMLSALITGTVDGGRPLTDTELIAMGSLLLAAGLDTVASMMGFITMFLAQHEEHRRRLIEHPEMIPVAVEELMRRHATANVGRLVLEDVEIGGVAMKAGDMVLTATTLACLDDRQFDDPMRVDFDRADKRSLVFGKGPHQCIGAHLARTEIRVFLGEWLTRIPDFAIRPGETPVSVPGRGNSVKYLPLVWPVGQAG